MQRRTNENDSLCYCFFGAVLGGKFLFLVDKRSSGWISGTCYSDYYCFGGMIHLVFVLRLYCVLRILLKRKIRSRLPARKRFVARFRKTETTDLITVPRHYARIINFFRDAKGFALPAVKPLRFSFI